MTRLFKLSLAFIGLFIFSGCLRAKKASEDTQPPVAQMQSSGASPISFELLPDTNLHKYGVRFTKPADLEVNLMSRARDNGETSLPVIWDSNNSWIDTDLTEDSVYIYQFYAAGKSGLGYQLRVRVPRDYEVKEDQEWPSEFRNAGFGRLQLDHGVRITTMGKTLDIKAQWLSSDNAVIETFPHEHRAKKGENGKSGGLIKISAKEASGTLRFELRGENGGLGLSRPEIPVSIRPQGPKGPAGHNAVYELKPMPAQTMGLSGMPRYTCQTPPTAGGAGYAGPQGESGLSGMDGGDSGNLILHLHSSDAFAWTVEKQAGRGGAGGPGGPGGRGGPGGDPGKPTPQSGITYFPPPEDRCKDADIGPNGPEGQVGNEGPSGRDGAVGTACEYDETAHSDCR